MSNAEFACHVCGVQCDIAPPLPELPVCEKHCEDHEYEHEKYDRCWYCKHCNKIQDVDWDDGDDFGFIDYSPRQPDSPIGKPLSEITGRDLDRLADEWRGQ